MPAPNIPGAIVAPIQEKDDTMLERIAMSLAAQAPQLAYMLFAQGRGADPSEGTFEQKGVAQESQRQLLGMEGSPTQQAAVGAGIGDANTSSTDIASLLKGRLPSAAPELMALRQQQAFDARDAARTDAITAASMLPTITAEGEAGHDPQRASTLLQSIFSMEDAGMDASTINLLSNQMLADLPTAQNLLAFARDKAALTTAEDQHSADVIATQRISEIIKEPSIAGEVIHGASQTLLNMYDAMYSATQERGVDAFQESVDLAARLVGQQVAGMDPTQAMLAANGDMQRYVELTQPTYRTVDEALAMGAQFLQAIDIQGISGPIIARLNTTQARREVELQGIINQFEGRLRAGETEDQMRAILTAGPAPLESGAALTTAEINRIIKEAMERSTQPMVLIR